MACFHTAALKWTTMFYTRPLSAKAWIQLCMFAAMVCDVSATLHDFVAPTKLKRTTSERTSLVGKKVEERICEN